MNAREIISSESFEPVCKFGPGGDYVTYWPKKKTCSSESPGSVGKVLSSIAELLGISILPEMLKNSPPDSNLQAGDYDIKMEERKSAAQSSFTDAKTAAGSSHSLGLSKEPMLFDNPSGVSAKTSSKQNYHIRTRRRVTRKRPAFIAPWQGTLFETNPTGTRVA